VGDEGVRLRAPVRPWATVEEFRGDEDADYLREVIAGFIGLAARARQHGESLFCWVCL
jgi:hypothetical protein